MKRWLLAWAWVTAAAVAKEPAPEDFAWRATLEVPPGAALARVALPGEALARLQSPALADLRVFDGEGRAVSFARVPPSPAPQERTAAGTYPALPLFGTEPGTRLPRGAVQVQARDTGGVQVWVRMGEDAGETAAPEAAARRLPAALFDTRALEGEVVALRIAGEWPPNMPVQLRASASADLSQWTPLPLKGRVYRFAGEGAPASDTLELAQPARLAGKYLRLEWQGQEGVRVEAVTGLVGPPPRPSPGGEGSSVSLGQPRADEARALEWALPFATPVVALALRPAQPNTVLPVRVLGRNAPSQPWRQLGQGLVYRLGRADSESFGPAIALQAVPVRFLRVEATHGQALPPALAARVLFEPVELVFAASGAGPYRVAAGRADTPAAALPLALLLQAQPGHKPEALPPARIVASEAALPPAPPAWAAWLPAGTDARTVTLWAVLLAGVAVLGAAAWSLLRSSGRGSPGPEAGADDRPAS